MSFKATVTAGWEYKTGDTATAANLNALGIPDVTIPDNQTYAISVGALATPGIAFNGDANTGLAQLAGADTLSIVAGGAEIVRITSTQAGFANGTAAAPSITFIGDGNTGINHDSGDELEVVCGGGVVATFLTSGVNVVGNVEADSITVNGLAVKTGGVDTATVSFATDFFGSSTSWGTTSTVSGTGAVTAQNIGPGNFDTGGNGYIRLQTPANTDRASVHVAFNVQETTGIARFRVLPSNPLSTPSNRYNVFVGLCDPSSVTVSSGTGVWFQYDDSASAQWQTVTYNGTTRETQTTGVTYTIAATYMLEIRRTASSTWQFYINGALQTTHSTVTFANGDSAILGVGVVNTTGTGGSLYVDSIECQSPLART